MVCEVEGWKVTSVGDCPLASRYPGDRYVTWIGLDGYMRKPRRTFANIFARSLTQIGRFTVWIRAICTVRR